MVCRCLALSSHYFNAAVNVLCHFHFSCWCCGERILCVALPFIFIPCTIKLFFYFFFLLSARSSIRMWVRFTVTNIVCFCSSQYLPLLHFFPFPVKVVLIKHYFTCTGCY
ncbi:conserved hypothetical protein, unlikely [Trypanosoma brucei gambiense DAL972]|uniref:Uncharacterized protein n=1 Tax=Trypanosoma brucei gambiense (strain MHOM/CI/86/DAL972) TaxID=679716 RepID=C9ZZ01_TRYB9|nr:conserved hypothetical protein, unlikely [Trypanosoma brucei gambiense DAL972]CBH14650.1 conserved hypothetical protein, unlikely [Trypanosoma brucei gambiense DAL972]|eukprot:XP_011776916.1 conserved hypothetical protein, unlikely [Trypanosoma brucei gambiense DAL972]